MAKIKLDDFATAVDEIFADFVKAEYETRQAALKAGADVMIQRLKANSPRDEGGFAESWAVKDYRGAVYVHNTKTVSTKGTGTGKKTAKKVASGIPLSNILEYKAGGKPFIRATADAAEADVFNAIKNKLNGG